MDEEILVKNLKQLRESELPSNYKYNAVFNYLFLSLLARLSYTI